MIAEQTGNRRSEASPTTSQRILATAVVIIKGTTGIISSWNEAPTKFRPTLLLKMHGSTQKMAPLWAQSLLMSCERCLNERMYQFRKRSGNKCTTLDWTSGPEPVAPRSYEDDQEKENKIFMEYCREFSPDDYPVLKD